MRQQIGCEQQVQLAGGHRLLSVPAAPALSMVTSCLPLAAPGCHTGVTLQICKTNIVSTAAVPLLLLLRQIWCCTKPWALAQEHVGNDLLADLACASRTWPQSPGCQGPNRSWLCKWCLLLPPPPKHVLQWCRC
jgi:hypothetical protein